MKVRSLFYLCPSASKVSTLNHCLKLWSGTYLVLQLPCTLTLAFHDQWSSNAGTGHMELRGMVRQVVTHIRV
jgi:hypothetical protein